MTPRLLAELLALQPLADQPQALQCLADMAPVRYQSGKVSVVYLPTNETASCDTHYLWADPSCHYCDWARIYYETHRKKARAMRARSVALGCAG